MFTINREKWLVKFEQPSAEIFITEDGSRTIGVCDDATKTIHLANSLRGKLLKKVLCHELVHAAMFSYNIKFCCFTGNCCFKRCICFNNNVTIR